MIDRRACARPCRAICGTRLGLQLLLFVSLAVVAVAQPTTPDTSYEKPAPRLDVRPLVFGGLLSPALTTHSTSFTVKAGSDECGVYESATRFKFNFDAFAT